MKVIKLALLAYNSLVVFAFLTVGSFKSDLKEQLLPILLIIPVGIFFAVSLANGLTGVSDHIHTWQFKVIKKLAYLYSLIVSALLLIAILSTAANTQEMVMVIMMIPLVGYFVICQWQRMKTVRHRSAKSLLKPTPLVKKRQLPASQLAKTLKEKISTPVMTAASAIKIQIEDLDDPVTDLIQTEPEELAEIVEEIDGERQTVKDRDRRQFLKLLGGTSVGLFVMSLVMPNKASAAFFGSVPGPGVVGLKDSLGTKIDPAEKFPTDGYNITEIDDDDLPAYYGFVNKQGHWYISKEDATGAYRYFKGTTMFSDQWEVREGFVYGYFDEIFGL